MDKYRTISAVCQGAGLLSGYGRNRRIIEESRAICQTMDALKHIVLLSFVQVIKMVSCTLKTSNYLKHNS